MPDEHSLDRQYAKFADGNIEDELQKTSELEVAQRSASPNKQMAKLKNNSASLSIVIEHILRHCGLWKDKIPRSPPQIEKPQMPVIEEPHYDYTFFDRVCA